jgi:L-fucose mutarotase
VLPLAGDVDHPVAFMQVSGTQPPYLSGLQREILVILATELLSGQSAEPLERFAFYDRAKAAYAIVVTGELQPFGNFILRKGVISENLRP